MTTKEYREQQAPKRKHKKRETGEAAERFHTTKEDYERLADESSPVEVFYSIYLMTGGKNPVLKND